MRILLYTTQSRLLTLLEKKAFENIVGKGENAGNQHFLLFPKCFSILPKTNFIFFFWITFILSTAYPFNLVLCKILSFGRRVKHIHVAYNRGTNN